MTTKHPKTKLLKIQSVFLFLIFPLCQVTSLLLLAGIITSLYQIPVSACLTFLALFLVFAVLLSYLLYRRHKQNILSMNYQELTSLQQYQTQHYDKIRRQREQLENDKHKFGQQMEEILFLLEAGNTDDTLAAIQDLLQKVEATREYPFCSNPVINSVLSEKQAVCLEKQIAFQAELNIGDCASVEKVHLCSIFSNLLDNAVEACSHIPVAKDRFVRLTALQTGNFMHIKVVNSAISLVASKERHGYGQKILKDIAGKYSGEFRTQFKNGQYEAFLTIQIP